MMQKLELDFRRARPASPWARWALFVVAVAFSAELAVSYHGVRQTIAQNEARLIELGPATAAGALGARAPAPEEVRLARETVERLGMPWENLFGALESTLSDKVALLTIEPNAGAGTVVISGEATDYRAALDYVARLGEAPTLKRAHLVRHERRQDGPQQPVAFSVSAAWSKAQ